MKTIGVLTAAALFMIGSAATTQLAHAQQAEGTTDYQTDGLEPRPTPPSPVVGTAEQPGVQLQAGVGSDTAFASAGVVELGGSAGFMIASRQMVFDLAPSIGYFIADNLQVSVLAGVNYTRVERKNAVTGNDNAESASTARLLLEPSYHLPFNDAVFGFLGMGFGATYSDDQDFGFAIAPRIGSKIMVGRSGILTPAVSFIYSTEDVGGAAPGPGSTASNTVTVSSSLIISVGYTVML